jgi:hypothetical protein
MESGLYRKQNGQQKDTIDTTSRIQNAFNDYDKRLILSIDLLEKMGSNNKCKIETPEAIFSQVWSAQQI